MNKKCKNLFLESRDFSDNVEFMKEFVDLVKEFVDWNRGDVNLVLIDLHKHGFERGEMFIIYNDCGGGMVTEAFSGLDFIELIIETFEEYSDEEYLEDFWIERLENLINKFD